MAAVFRLARLADAHLIAAVHASSWADTYRGLLPSSYLKTLQPDSLTRHWRDRLLREQARKTTYVVEDARGVAGFVVIGGCRSDADLAGFAGEVYMLYVHPDRQGEGLGRVLLRGALAELARREFFWVVIWVVKANRNAQAFYGHMGLRLDAGSRWDEFHGRRVAVVRYAQHLNPVVDFAALLRAPAGK